jgi:hypothetical protein
LYTGNSALTDEKMLFVIVGSVSAAHACAEAINRRSDNVVEFKTCDELGDAFRLIANCAKRVPTKVRRRLKEGVLRLIREGPVDLEVIEAVFDFAASVFAEFPKEEAAKTALCVIMSPYHDRVVVIKSDYSVIGGKHQRKAEDAITAIAKASNDKTTASDVFNALASAIDSNLSKQVDTEIHNLKLDYVTKVAGLWHAVGLRPARAPPRGSKLYKQVSPLCGSRSDRGDRTLVRAPCD